VAGVKCKEAKLVRLLAVFIVAFGLGAYASLHLLSEYVESIQKSHEFTVKQGFESFKYANTKNAAPIIEVSNLLARYSACELSGDEGDAIAVSLSMNALHLGMLSKQTTDSNKDTFYTSLMLYAKLKGNESATAKLTETIVAYCEENLSYLYDCEKFENLTDEKLEKLKPKCT
jgi:hypothetical protein